jgi:hypothetical protein
MSETTDVASLPPVDLVEVEPDPAELASPPPHCPAEDDEDAF